jgi:hypothetical protein
MKNANPLVVVIGPDARRHMATVVVNAAAAMHIATVREVTARAARALATTDHATTDHAAKVPAVRAAAEVATDRAIHKGQTGMVHGLKAVEDVVPRHPQKLSSNVRRLPHRRAPALRQLATRLPHARKAKNAHVAVDAVAVAVQVGGVQAAAIHRMACRHPAAIQ